MSFQIKTCSGSSIEMHTLDKPPVRKPCLSRDRLVVRTLRCGRSNPGSNPGHGKTSSLLSYFASCDRRERKIYASAGNRTRINCLEGSYADHYTTDAEISICLLDIHPKLNYNKLPPGDNVLFALDPMLNQLLVFYHFNMSGGYSSVVEQSAAVR